MGFAALNPSCNLKLLLIIILLPVKYSSSPLTEGRFMRRHKAERIDRVGAGDAAFQGLTFPPANPVNGRGREPKVWMRCPRPCLARTAPGGPGSPSGPTTGVCLRWLDEDRTNRGETCGDHVCLMGAE
jgi:hypothetical protein